jgi:hypothetical protein
MSIASGVIIFLLKEQVYDAQYRGTVARPHTGRGTERTKQISATALLPRLEYHGALRLLQRSLIASFLR